MIIQLTPNPMEYSTFYKNYIFHYCEDDKGLRIGQFFMNELAEYNFELYKSVPPELDCFYDDTLFCYCSDWVSENWKDTVNTKTTEEPEMPITKPEFYIEPEVIEDLWTITANYKTFAKSIADMMSSSTKESVSRQWATALSGLIDKLGGDSSALWEWEGKTPTPEKVVECLRENIQYIADGELESCCAVMEMNEGRVSGNVLRAIRRPKPTLKSQALRDFETVRKHSDLLPEILDTIEKALKSIPE